jgi:hypothetical protein
MRLPRSDATLADDPPPRPSPPRDGPNDSESSRRVTVHVVAGEERVTLAAWCRVGVWTTLQDVEAVDFVVRESWGRLLERKPRLLARVEDQALGGVIARLRPEDDGSVSFEVEVAEARLLPAETAGIWHGQRVVLRRPRRHGYRFSGRGSSGIVAEWDPVRVCLGDVPEAPRREGAFALGEGGAWETFEETWRLLDPVHVVAEGVERMDYRLERERRAAGFDGVRAYGSSGR